MRVDIKQKNRIIFLKNFIGGLGWMTGATIGFALGLPIIGDFAANLIEVTNKALEAKRTFPR